MLYLCNKTVSCRVVAGLCAKSLKPWLSIKRSTYQREGDTALMSRIEREHCLLVLHNWQGYLTEFSYNFIFDRIVYVLVTFYQWGHFVMLIRRNLNFISVQSWTFICSLRKKMVEHTKQGVRSLLFHRLSYEASQEQLMGNDGENSYRALY